MLAFGLSPNIKAQSHGGVDQYYSVRKTKPVSVIPIIYMETADHWYGECRYNYEADETLSVHAGRTFKGTKGVAYSFSPIVGIVAGKFDGYSLGLNSVVEYKRYSLSSQCQYAVSAKDHNLNFAYNWTDASYRVVPHISLGISVQQTKTFCSSMTEAGVFVKAVFKKWAVPVYYFNPPGREKYFMVGVSYEWQQKQRRN